MKIVLLYMALAACALSPAEASEEAPAPVAAPAADPTPPWDFSRAWVMDVDRSETFETRLDGHELWYKDRGTGRTRMQVNVESAKPGAPVTVRVPHFQRESDARGARRTLRFDPTLLDERYDGRRVRVFHSDGGAEEREALAALAERPWHELAWSGGAWSRATVVAEGHAWPIADALPLGRELTVLLPALAGRAEKGAVLRQAVLLPYPVPLAPLATAVMEYRVEDVVKEEGRLVAVLSFSATVQEAPDKGVEWGGIALAGARLEALLTGQLRADLDSRRLLDARLEVRVTVERAASGEPFRSEWKTKTSWKAARK